LKFLPVPYLPKGIYLGFVSSTFFSKWGGKCPVIFVAKSAKRAAKCPPFFYCPETRKMSVYSETAIEP